MFKRKKGFTVIEIVIVIAVVAIIAGIWYTSKNKAGADVMPSTKSSSTSSEIFSDGSTLSITNVKLNGSPSNPASANVAPGDSATLTFDVITKVKSKKGSTPGTMSVQDIFVLATKYINNEPSAEDLQPVATLVNTVTKGTMITYSYSAQIVSSSKDSIDTLYKVYVDVSALMGTEFKMANFPVGQPRVYVRPPTTTNPSKPGSGTSGDTTGTGSSGSGSGTAGGPTTSQ